MNEKVDLTSQNFQPIESGLYVPGHVANPKAALHTPNHELSPAHQEMKAQLEVMGTDGHGSIRSKTEELPDIGDHVDRILDLKDSFDKALAKRESEATFSFDKRLDKDGSRAAGALALKSQMIDSFVTKWGKTLTKEQADAAKAKVTSLIDKPYKELEDIDKGQRVDTDHLNDTAIQVALPDLSDPKLTEAAGTSDRKRREILWEKARHFASKIPVYALGFRRHVREVPPVNMNPHQ